MELRSGRLTLQAWDNTRNFTRRVTAIAAASAARLELTVERFARREGSLFLLDLGRPAGAEMSRRSGRMVFRERFRLFLKRQFPEWDLAEVSTEPNLEHSLSPAFPRAFLKHGASGWAALACPPEGNSGNALTFALIWLSYLRRREKRCTVEGLAVYVPAGREREAALRLLCLNGSARFETFAYDEADAIRRIDPADHGNLDTQLEPCRRSQFHLREEWAEIAALPGVECIPLQDGRASLRVRGIEFAQASGGELTFGLDEKRTARPQHQGEIARLAAELARLRGPAAADRQHALYRQYPEAWLESQVRAHLETIDASLAPDPVYGQVPAFAGGERDVMDLLAVDRQGRLAVLELKASADLHLPMQALDYWIRVKWHLDRGEFSPRGYFPGRTLRTDPPRLILVSPSLEFHPTIETLLAFFSPGIDVERVGLAENWRESIEVMFRLRGAERPR